VNDGAERKRKEEGWENADGLPLTGQDRTAAMTNGLLVEIRVSFLTTQNRSTDVRTSSSRACV